MYSRSPENGNVLSETESQGLRKTKGFGPKSPETGARSFADRFFSTDSGLIQHGMLQVEMRGCEVCDFSWRTDKPAFICILTVKKRHEV
jgi:hypothetical protein